MRNQEIIDQFKTDGDTVWANTLAYMDCLVIDSHNKDYQIKDKDIAEIKKAFTAIEEDETVLFFRDTSFFNQRNQGCVITDQRIHVIFDNNDSDSYYYMDWVYIISVSIKKGNYCFSFKEDCFSLEPKLLLKNNSKDFTIQKRVAEFLNEIASIAQRIIMPLWESIEKIDDENISDEERETIAKEMIGRYPEYDGIFLYYLGCRAYDKEEFAKASEFMIKALECEQLSDEARSYSNLVLGEIGLRENNRESVVEIKTRLWDALCFECSPNTTIDDKTTVFERALECLYQLDEYVTANINQLPYHVKKLLVPINNYESLSTEHKLSEFAISISALRTSNLSFPIGHPIIGNIYVAHPAVPEKYILLEDHDIEIAEDKIREFCYLVQCLGATSITISTNKCSNKSQSIINSSNIGAEGSINEIRLGAEAKEATVNRLEERLSHLMRFNQEFYPVVKPYLPNDLVWFDHEETWKRLAKQRLSGSLIKHSEHIEINKSRAVQANELSKVVAECKFMFKEAAGFIETCKRILRESLENITVNIEVSFRPIDEYGGYIKA